MVKEIHHFYYPKRYNKIMVQMLPKEKWYPTGTLNCTFWTKLHRLCLLWTHAEQITTKSGIFF